MFKVIIAGGREFNNYHLLKHKCDIYLKDVEGPIQIVNGQARGADALGGRYAEEEDHYMEAFEADWDKFGKSAGYRRNEEMAKYADALIAFWDGKSKGTSHMIELAEKYDLVVRVVRY